MERSNDTHFLHSKVMEPNCKTLLSAAITPRLIFPQCCIALDTLFSLSHTIMFSRLCGQYFQEWLSLPTTAIGSSSICQRPLLLKYWSSVIDNCEDGAQRQPISEEEGKQCERSRGTQFCGLSSQ